VKSFSFCLIVIITNKQNPVNPILNNYEKISKSGFPGGGGKNSGGRIKDQIFRRNRYFILFLP